MDSKIGSEMRLVVVEAIRGQCASFMILTATVSDIFGGQTNSSMLASATSLHRAGFHSRRISCTANNTILCIQFCFTVDLYLYRRVCVYVCVYPSDGIHVATCCPIRIKFSTHMQIHLQMVVS